MSTVAMKTSLAAVALATFAVALGSAARGQPAPVLMSCGGDRLAVTYGEATATLVFAGQTIELAQTVSGSGARYEKAGDAGTWFWNKGDVGTLAVNGATLPVCAPLAAIYAASGNEPGWRVEVWPGEWLSFRPQEGERILVTPAPAAVTEGDATRYTMAQNGRRLELTVRRSPCADTMTGMPHPDTVSLSLDGRTLTGCGGAPASLLTGVEWKVQSVAGVPVDPDSAMVAVFNADGHLAGKAPCNRFMGPWSITGEGLAIGPAAATMMACPGEAMERERTFFDVLNAVIRFEIASDGALVLHAADGRSIRAVR